MLIQTSSGLWMAIDEPISSLNNPAISLEIRIEFTLIAISIETVLFNQAAWVLSSKVSIRNELFPIVKLSI